MRAALLLAAAPLVAGQQWFVDSTAVYGATDLAWHNATFPGIHGAFESDGLSILSSGFDLTHVQLVVRASAPVPAATLTVSVWGRIDLATELALEDGYLCLDDSSDVYGPQTPAVFDGGPIQEGVHTYTWAIPDSSLRVGTFPFTHWAVVLDCGAGVLCEVASTAKLPAASRFGFTAVNELWLDIPPPPSVNGINVSCWGPQHDRQFLASLGASVEYCPGGWRGVDSWLNGKGLAFLDGQIQYSPVRCRSGWMDGIGLCMLAVTSVTLVGLGLSVVIAAFHAACCHRKKEWYMPLQGEGAGRGAAADSDASSISDSEYVSDSDGPPIATAASGDKATTGTAVPSVRGKRESRWEHASQLVGLFAGTMDEWTDCLFFLTTDFDVDEGTLSKLAFLALVGQFCVVFALETGYTAWHMLTWRPAASDADRPAGDSGASSGKGALVERPAPKKVLCPLLQPRYRDGPRGVGQLLIEGAWLLFRVVFLCVGCALRALAISMQFTAFYPVAYWLTRWFGSSLIIEFSDDEEDTCAKNVNSARVSEILLEGVPQAVLQWYALDLARLRSITPSNIALLSLSWSLLHMAGGLLVHIDWSQLARDLRSFPKALMRAFSSVRTFSTAFAAALVHLPRARFSRGTGTEPSMEELTTPLQAGDDSA